MCEKEPFNERDPKLLSVIGLQNSGKTRFVLSVLRTIGERGLVAGVLKHDGHADAAEKKDNAGFDTGSARRVLDWEKPGSDTLLSFSAGASMTMVTGGGQSLLHIGADTDAGNVYALSARMSQLAKDSGRPLDVIVVEGFKKSPLPKVFICRTSEHIAWLKAHEISNIRAVIVPYELRGKADAAWPIFAESQVIEVITACGVQL